jgi:hypothetical protein
MMTMRTAVELTSIICVAVGMAMYVIHKMKPTKPPTTTTQPKGRDD